MQTKTVKCATWIQLRLKQHKTVDYDRYYAQGFSKACEVRRIDALQVLDIAKTLELHL